MFPAILLAASCSGVRDCAPAQLNLPAEIAENAGDTLTAADIEWWKFYGDSALCTLISRTLEHNKDLSQPQPASKSYSRSIASTAARSSPKWA